MRPEVTSFLLQADLSTLTPNQRKKRRQKLSKQGKRSQTTSTDAAGTASSTAAQSDLATASFAPEQLAQGISEAASANNQATSVIPGSTEAQSPATASLPSQPAPHSAAACQLASSSAQNNCEKHGQPLLPAAPVCRADLSGAAALMLQPDVEPMPAASAQPHAAEHETQQEPRSAGPVGLFVHGNYSSYYSRRFGEDLGDDPRLEVLDKRWFRNKRCMDIGCNDGRLTLTMAAKYGCASMLGLDIDASLIKQACRSAALHLSPHAWGLLCNH